MYYLVLCSLSRFVLYSPPLVYPATDVVDHKELKSKTVSHQLISDILEGALKKQTTEMSESCHTSGS